MTYGFLELQKKGHIFANGGANVLLHKLSRSLGVTLPWWMPFSITDYSPIAKDSSGIH